VRRFDSPLAPLSITAIAYLLLVMLVLRHHEFDPSYFVQAGDFFSDPNLAPRNLRVLPNSFGYDGQFYYRLALDPFTSSLSAFGVSLGTAPYRQQRIIYPLLVWLASLGRVAFVPAMLIAVNYGALCLTAWLGGLVAQANQRHALWGLILAGYPGFLFTLAKDLTEIIAACFLLASVLMLRRERYIWAALLFSLAILSKETTLLIAVGGLLSWLPARRRNTNTGHQYLLAFLTPLVVWIGWQSLLFARWGAWPVLTGGGNIGWPFAGIGALLQSVLMMRASDQRLTLVELGFIASVAVSSLYALRASAATYHEKMSWLLYALFIMLLTDYVWGEDWAFFRALTEFYALGAIVVLGSSLKLRSFMAAWAATMWLILFRGLILYY
jgi:hypothetical protein